MNIHEHQAKDLLKQFGAPVPKGVVIYDTNDLLKKIQVLNSNKLIIKAQIHAGGRGKAGGIKIVKNFNDLNKEAKGKSQDKNSEKDEKPEIIEKEEGS